MSGIIISWRRLRQRVSWLPDGRGVCDVVLDSISRACDVQEKAASKIRIGLLETTQFCADYVMIKPENKVGKTLMEDIQWERRDMHSLPGALDEGLFDLVITWSGEKPYFRDKETGWKVIFRSPDAVFIPRGNPLFDGDFHSFADLRSLSVYYTFAHGLSALLRFSAEDMPEIRFFSDTVHYLRKHGIGQV